MSARFILIRHGEAEGNRELRYLGASDRSDVALTERGARQVGQLATALRDFPLRAIYTSPLLRARATADALASIVGLPSQIFPDLREQHYGAWEGLTATEARERDPALYAAWETGTDAGSTPPQGESMAQVAARVLACADTLAAQYMDADDGGLVALVSHVGPIKTLIAAALGLPPMGMRRMWLDPASYSVIDWRPGSDDVPSTGLLRVFNSIAHLDPPARWLRPS